MKKDWTYKKLGDCLSYIKNGANIKQTKGATGIPITRIETLSGGVFNRDRLGYADITDVKKYESFYLETGDLLLSHINSKTYIGRTVMYSQEAEEKIIHGMNLLRLKVIKEQLTPAFFCYYAKSDRFKADIVKIRKDAVNQSSICISDIVQITIPVPPISIQESIVRELDAIHGILEKKQEQLRELDNLAQAIFYDMFGDPITNPKQWEVKKLGEVAPAKAYKKEITSVNGLYWLLNLDMVESNTGIIIEKLMLPMEEIGNSTTTFNNEYVLYSKLRPYLNKVVLPTDEGYCTSELVPLLPDKKCLSREYLCYLLRSNTFVEFISNKVAGAKMPRVSMQDFREFALPLPPLSLQQSFAAKIEAIEAQKQAVQQSIREVEALRAERMDHYFS